MMQAKNLLPLVQDDVLKKILGEIIAKLDAIGKVGMADNNPDHLRDIVNRIIKA